MFKKLKDFYKRNRVYSILMLVSIICVVAIAIGVVFYFIGQTSKDKYGNRLDGIEKVKINDDKKHDISSKISENELVDSTDIDIRGKLIYVMIDLKSGKHADAEAIAQASLELFSEEEKKFYDIQFIVNNDNSEEEESFPIMGYIKNGDTVIKWINYGVTTTVATGE